MRSFLSVTLLAGAYATRGHDADADARIGIRDALRALAGRAFADSVERVHPSPAAPERYDDSFFDKPPFRRAILHTSAGDMEWRFCVDDAPQTVKNFIALAKRSYFDSLRVHRVVPDFVIQDGDPTGTGSGGPVPATRSAASTTRCVTRPAWSAWRSPARIPAAASGS